METILRHRDEGQPTWFLNGLMLTKAGYAETGGSYCLMEHRLTAAANPPMHIHSDEEEAFFVLEGEVEIEVGGVVETATPGSFALLPRQIPHTFRVMSDRARLLVIASAPQGNTKGGAPHFFETVGEPASAIELPVPAAPDPVALTMAAADHAIEILPPPQ